jgi:hypothetical protein
MPDCAILLFFKIISGSFKEMNDTTLSIYSVFAPRKHKQKKAIKREWRLLAPGNSDPVVF